MVESREETSKRGCLKTFASYLERSKLGELLVMRGFITTKQLRHALKEQKQTSQPLGKILIQEEVITQNKLLLCLGRQLLLRAFATILLLVISSGAVFTKKAKADILRDIPASFSISAAKDFQQASVHPALFGSHEKKSENLSAFTKWTGMFDRFESSMREVQNQEIMEEWKEDLRVLQGRNMKHMAAEVNALVNARKYIIDSKNWGQSDYWATPVEFLRYGGDCEDFAIAKYTALRALGVPENRLRVAIVHDNIKDIPHAVLVIYAEDGAYILDNQTERMKSVDDVDRYRPIFSINRNAWWLHTQMDSTVLASINR